MTSRTSAKPTSITPVPGPWSLKGTVYAFMKYTSTGGISTLASRKDFLYSPLELGSSFNTGRFVGGLGMVQVIRYTESPVGPYDELVLIPGSFEYFVDDGDNFRKRRNLRITRIYVSQKDTCYNGRKNWNNPKHLANFSFITLPDKSVSISVTPLEDGQTPAPQPLFAATFTPTTYFPRLPISTSLASYIGLDLTLAQPPLPTQSTPQGELPGTERWCRLMPYEYCPKAEIGWWDLRQGEEGRKGGRAGSEHFWPGAGRWAMGVRMENTEFSFPVGEFWGEEDGS